MSDEGVHIDLFHKAGIGPGMEAERDRVYAVARDLLGSMLEGELFLVVEREPGVYLAIWAATSSGMLVEAVTHHLARLCRRFDGGASE